MKPKSAYILPAPASFVLGGPSAAEAAIMEAYPGELLILMAEAAKAAADKASMKPAYAPRPFWEYPAGPSEHYGF